MAPTFFGRIQTRIFLLCTIGLSWTLLISLLLAFLNGTTWLETIPSTLTVLAVTLVLGVVLWEPIYHQIMLRRWEKDWPTIYGLITMLNEGVLIWLVMFALDRFAVLSIWGAALPGIGLFLLHFITTWILVWLWANGPLRVFFIRWRFFGGRIV